MVIKIVDAIIYLFTHVVNTVVSASITINWGLNDMGVTLIAPKRLMSSCTASLPSPWENRASGMVIVNRGRVANLRPATTGVVQAARIQSKPTTARTGVIRYPKVLVVGTLISAMET